jgi:hypothetical protein
LPGRAALARVFLAPPGRGVPFMIVVDFGCYSGKIRHDHGNA